MTPQQVETAARRRYNAENSTFWSQDECFKVIYEGEQILARDALVIEARDTSTTTVAGTRGYAFPSRFIAVKRVEYDGNKLEPIDFRQDDVITLHDASTTDQGTPTYYSVWNDTIYLRLIPDATETLTIYGYKDATLLTTLSSSLSVPTRCAFSLVYYLAAMMASKDQKFEIFKYYMDLWEQEIKKHKAWTAKKKRTDGFAAVKDEESYGRTVLGIT